MTIMIDVEREIPPSYPSLLDELDPQNPYRLESDELLIVSNYQRLVWVVAIQQIY